MRKPRIFIGSSVESLPIADAINANLDHVSEVTLWRNGTFDLSNNSLDSLITKATQVDFALFIFSPDDLAIMREKPQMIVRDNVIFELGLFIGTIGRERCYIIKPRNVELHFPTDLLGLIAADYEPNRSDNDLPSATNVACTQIKSQINKLGLLDIKSKGAEELTIKKAIMTLSDVDFFVLAKLIETFTLVSGGYSLSIIRQELPDTPSTFIDLSAIKLEMAGLIQKQNSVDDYNNEYYTYSITQDGINYLLEHEERLYKSTLLNTQSNNRKAVATGDDLPF